ncbi:MAG: AAA family ATPase [Dehalococcoidia bacterium]
MSQQTPHRSEGLQLKLLGGFQVTIGTRVVQDADWRLRKAKAIVKLLALAPGRQVHREQLIEMLWPDLDASAGLNNLHKTLYAARRALAPESPVSGRFLRFENDVLELAHAEEISIDTEAFESAAAKARKTGDINAYRQAIAIYSGDLLPEDRYEDWAQSRREELRTLYHTLLMELAALYEAAGEITNAIESLSRVVASDPAEEAAQARLMRLYVLSGHRHHALRQYQRLRDVLQREMGVEPQLVTQQVYQEILDGDVQLPVAEESPSIPVSHTLKPRQFAQGSLVGREAEIELVEEALEGLFAGEGNALFLGGESGVGKSRLALEIADRAAHRGGISLLGAAYEGESQLPYGPFIEALEDFAYRASPETMRALLAQPHGEIFRLLPGQWHARHPGFQKIAPQTADRQVIFTAAVTFLQHLGSWNPVVLVQDDLHAADEACIQLLHYLARSSAQPPLLIVGTFRAEEAGVGTPLSEFLALARRHRILSRVDVGRLSRQESDYLVVKTLGASYVDSVAFNAIYDIAEGNPFYTEETVRAFQEEGRLRQVDGRWQLEDTSGTLPGILREVVAVRMGRLQSTTQNVLRLAAVIGRDVPYDVLKSASRVPEDELLADLDEALDRQVMEESEQGYRFVHPVHRSVLYQGLSRPRLQSLHGQVAEGLEALYESRASEHAEVLAHHHAMGSTPWRAIPYILSAARHAASVFANEQALRLYQQGVDLINAHPAHSDATALPCFLEEMADVMRRTGQAETSLPLYEEALERSLAADDLQAAGRIRGKAALNAMTAGKLDQASDLLHKAMETVGETYPAEVVVASTYYQLAQLHWHSARHNEALEAAEKALELAHSAGDEKAQAHAYEVMALACHSLGDWQKGIEYELNRSEMGVSGFDTDQAFDAHL